MREVLERQHRETAALRRWILSTLPLRRVSRIVVPGCGTGLVLRELCRLTGAELVGLDRDPSMLQRAAIGMPPGRALLVACDARRLAPKAGMYLSRFFLGRLPDPLPHLRLALSALPPGGLYACLGEYDYLWTAERGGDEGRALVGTISRDGLPVDAGRRLSELFSMAGFAVVRSGLAEWPASRPDPAFIELQMGRRDALPEGTELPWRIGWLVARRPLAERRR